MQPLNRSFCCRPQKPCKALCGRRCRPLCPARGSGATPRFLLLIFVPPADFRKRVRKPRRTALCFRRACVYPMRGFFSPHGATQGRTGRSLAAISMSLIGAHLADFRMLGFRELRFFRLRHGRGRNGAGFHIDKITHTRRHGFAVERVERFFQLRFGGRAFCER